MRLFDKIFLLCERQEDPTRKGATPLGRLIESGIYGTCGKTPCRAWEFPMCVKHLCCVVSSLDTAVSSFYGAPAFGTKGTRRGRV
jgi:invasion protein IalB